ncbi:MAG: S-adenosylmethionine:tRNA ribosyltransferase-isomerase [Acidimicrobiia bacterium]
MSAALAFDLPAGLEAHDPPEFRGLARDGGRLLVSAGASPPVHARFSELGRFLAAGDLLVVNTSPTLPAAIEAHRPGGGGTVILHLAGRRPDGALLVEPRRPRGWASLPFRGDLTGETLHLPGGGRARLVGRDPRTPRLWTADLDVPVPLERYLLRHGRPIRYGAPSEPWPISAYQNAYAVPTGGDVSAHSAGSAEMPSAGRPLTPAVLTELVSRGIGVTPLVLHTGVSSLEGHEMPMPEWFRVPPVTAERVNTTRAAGGRVVAVGTTVVRALESAAGDDGLVVPREGWTDLVVTPERGLAVVDGLLSGFHEPEASHLLMLEAVAGRAAIEAAYREALSGGYRWHEFGDSHLLLPAAQP